MRQMGPSAVKTAMEWNQLVQTLMTEQLHADLVLQGGYFINVVTREIYLADVAVKRGRVLLVGDVSSLIGPATNVEDVRGRFVCPGLIDAHMHVESSMLTVTEFSKLSIPSGTTTFVTDPHEIGNVLGVPGMQAMIAEARRLPNTVLFAVPCQVPDVPGLETSGDTVSSADMEELLDDPHVQGIGEIQGFANVGPVYRHAPEGVDDLLASVAYALSIGKTVEGNAPALSGHELAAHIIAGGGNVSCHETTTKEEAMEKLRNGVYVYMREGSSQRNMPECIRAIIEEGMDSRYAVIVTDDMVAGDLLSKGHMNDVVRRTIARGVDPVEAIQMATINPATHFGFLDKGALTPGKRADICVIDNLVEMSVSQVYLAGRKVAESGTLLIDIPTYHYPDTVRQSVKRKPVKVADVTVPATGSTARVRAVVAIADQNLTGRQEFDLPVQDGVIQPAPAMDVLPLLVLERHGRSGRIGKTFVHGMRLAQGAIAESVSHDTHNIIACGANYPDIVAAVNRVIAMGGGIAMIREGKVVGDLPLPVAGLLTDELSGPEVSARIDELHRLAREELGCQLHVPFMHLSFLSLVTSPEWKITDVGLIGVDQFEVLPTVV